MKQIEDQFQPLAEAVVGGLRTLASEDHEIASAFYALWVARARAHREPDRELAGILPGDQTQDQQELLESRRFVTFYGRAMAPGKNAVLPGRHLCGLRVRFHFRQIMGNMRGRRWGVVRSTEGQFLVPDVNAIVTIPISPIACLVCGYSDGNLSVAELAAINRWAYKGAVDYVVAKDFGACPIR
jgi:hypothetical protein